MTKVVSLIHGQETFQVSSRILVRKCDLFTDDPSLAGSPYTPTSQVSLADFREFVSVLEDQTVTITNANFRGLSRLCDEFRFRDLSGQLSRFRESGEFKGKETREDSETRISIPLTEINHCRALLEDAFRFTARSATFECSVGQAVALSPAVREQLSVDACARTFTFQDASSVDAVRCLLSGEAVSNVPSQTLLRRQLCNPGLELALLGDDRLDLSSLDLSILSVEALGDLLAGA
jgi:hypothetical protein